MPKVNHVRKDKDSKLAIGPAKPKTFSSVVKISQDNCKGCRLCVVHCPKGMLKVNSSLNKLGFYAVVFDRTLENKCSGCRFCCIVCPEGCIEVIRLRQHSGRKAIDKKSG